MKKSLSIMLSSLVLLSAISAVPAAHALSCMQTDMYLESIIGNDETIVFIGTSINRTDTDDYTSEVVSVTTPLQGYVESELFVYHQKHPDWNYLCNAGPQTKGSTGVYVVHRDTSGNYNVSQRLSLEEKITTDFLALIEEAEVEGDVFELTNTDQQNQIRTTIGELVNKIIKLLQELKYWQGQ